MRRALDDGDLAAKAAIGLRKFETDIAPAEDNEMRGQKVHVHHRAVREVRDLLEPGNRRHHCPRADVDENLVRAEHLIVDLHLLGSDEATVAFKDRTSLQPLQ